MDALGLSMPSIDRHLCNEPRQGATTAAGSRIWCRHGVVVMCSGTAFGEKVAGNGVCSFSGLFFAEGLEAHWNLHAYHVLLPHQPDPTRSFITHVLISLVVFNFHFLCTSFSCLVTWRSPDQMRACIPQPSPAPVVQGKSWKQVADRFNCLFLSACSPFHGCVYISCQPPYKWLH